MARRTCVWEMSTDEAVPYEKELNCANVTEINILGNTSLKLHGKTQFSWRLPGNGMRYYENYWSEEEKL